MGRLSKDEWKTHERADALVVKSLEKPLTDDEVDFVMEGWRPEATNNIAAAGAFFTPVELSLDVAMFMGGGDGMTCVDLCAGIGCMTWGMMRRNWNYKMRYVAVELNPSFVEVGKRLLPNVEWVCGSALDRKLIESLGFFDMAVSNPPFGKVPTAKDGDWLNYRGVVDLQICEVIARIATDGAMVILPASSVPWGRNQWEKNNNPKEYNRWCEANPGLILEPTSLDPKCYTFKSTGVAFDIADIMWKETGDLSLNPYRQQLGGIVAEQMAMF